jgi:hypothetical protein
MNNTIVHLLNGDFYVEYPNSKIQPMKKKILSLFLLLFIIVLGSCSTHTGKEIVNENDKPYADYRVIKIGECEYIEVNQGTVYALTHKGDCKNHEQEDWK